MKERREKVGNVLQNIKNNFDFKSCSYFRKRNSTYMMLDNENNVETAAGDKYTIHKLAGSGLGLVATTNIAAGDIVIRETPLLVIPAEVKSDRYSW